MHRPEHRSCASEVTPPGSKLVNPIHDAVPDIPCPKTLVFRRTNMLAGRGLPCNLSLIHAVCCFACVLLVLHKIISFTNIYNS